jgi:hypothetical protein
MGGGWKQSPPNMTLKAPVPSKEFVGEQLRLSPTGYHTYISLVDSMIHVHVSGEGEINQGSQEANLEWLSF